MNVLFIAVDDLRPELGAYGVKRVATPNIDSLASEGVVFLRAYAQQASCSPSRTSLLTGLRPDSTGIYDLTTHFRDTVPDVVTLPQHFKDNGYSTVGMGKIFHAGLNDDRSWSSYRQLPQIGMYQSEENIELVSRKIAAAESRGLKGRQFKKATFGPAWESADVPDSAYRDGALADLAADSLRELVNEDEPFFLAVGFYRPHLPFNAPKRYWDMYDRDAIMPAGNPLPPDGAPPYALTNWKELRAYHGIPPQGSLSEDQAKELVHGYLASTSYIDAQVGRLVKLVEDLGVRDNTIIVLWGDHGFKLGEYGSWGKHTNFEVDTRSPLLISAPGVRANGSSSNALVEFVDIYPSLVELAGLETPGHLEGTSFVPLLENPDRPWKSGALSQYPRRNMMGYSLRTDTYRLTLWQEKDDPEKVVARELYDHSSDPEENVNVSGNPAMSQIVEELTRKIRGGWQELLPAPEQPRL